MLRSISRVALLCGLLSLTAASEGCQRGSAWNLVPVEGTVTKGGHPLHGIEVVFLADSDAGTEGPKVTGKTDEAGHYHLRTDNGDDGAVAGKYRVLVLDVEALDKQIPHLSHGILHKEATQLSKEMAQRESEQRKMTGDAS